MNIGVLRRLWFPIVLALIVAVAFLAFGPPSGSPTASERLAALAPPGAGSGAFSPPPDASPTELEIAKRYETVRQFPDTVDAYVLLGNAYLQHVREKGDPTDYGRAEAAFHEALRRQPENLDALVGKGVLALAQHHFTTALALGQQAVAISPRSARAHGVVVDALTELGRYDDALASTQTMVNLRPDLASWSRVSYQRELRGDIDGAIEAMSRAYDTSVGTSVENREYIRVLIGDLHLLKGETKTAGRIYQASLNTSPGFVWALAGLARTEAARGDFEASIAHYQQAVDTIPLPEFLVALGEAQEAAGLETEARHSYELVQAIQALLAENTVNVDLELAIFETNHGDPGRALDLAIRAYRDQPNVKASDALAWALYLAGRSEEARRYVDEALRLGSDYGPFHFHAGMIALDLGDEEAAGGHLARALDAYPTLSPLDRSSAEQTLERLDH